MYAAPRVVSYSPISARNSSTRFASGCNIDYAAARRRSDDKHCMDDILLSNPKNLP